MPLSCQYLEWDFFAKNILKPLTIFAKSFILDARRGSKYASDYQV